MEHTLQVVAYHLMRPALSTEEAGPMNCLQYLQMQDQQRIKQPLAYRIGSALVEAWCRLGEDCPPQINYANPS